MDSLRYTLEFYPLRHNNSITGAFLQICIPHRERTLMQFDLRVDPFAQDVEQGDENGARPAVERSLVHLV